MRAIEGVERPASPSSQLSPTSSSNGSTFDEMEALRELEAKLNLTSDWDLVEHIFMSGNFTQLKDLLTDNQKKNEIILASFLL